MAYPNLSSLKLHDDEASSTGVMFSNKYHQTYKTETPLIVQLAPGTEAPGETPAFLQPLFQPSTTFLVSDSFDNVPTYLGSARMIAMNTFATKLFDAVLLNSRSMVLEPGTTAFDHMVHEVVDFLKKTGTAPLASPAGSIPSKEDPSFDTVVAPLVASAMPREFRRMIALRIKTATEWLRLKEPTPLPEGVSPLDAWREPGAFPKFYNRDLLTMLTAPGNVTYEQIVTCCLFMKYNMTISDPISKIGEVLLHFLKSALLIRVFDDTLFTEDSLVKLENRLGLPAFLSIAVPGAHLGKKTFGIRRVAIGVPYCDACARGGFCNQLDQMDHDEFCVIARDEPAGLLAWPDYGPKDGDDGDGVAPPPPRRRRVVEE
jgi:hypothetical protein